MPPASAPAAPARPPLGAALACMLLAALLRLPGLGAQSLWYDEIYSVQMAGWPVDVIVTVEDGHPPLYALLMKLATLVSSSDLTGRVISALAGIATVGLIVLVGARLADRATGVIAGFMLAVSPLHVWYSREGRMYALVVLCAVGSTLALARALDQRGLRAWAAFGVVTLTGLLTHYLYGALVLAQLAYLAVRRLRGWVTPGRLAAAAVAVAAAATIAVPLIGLPEMQLVGTQRGFEWLAVPYTLFVWVAGYGLGPSVEELHRQRGTDALLAHAPEIAVVGLVGAALLLAGLRRLAVFGTYRLYVLLWLLAPPAIVLGGAWLRAGGYNVRYAIAAFPAFVLVAAAGIAHASRAVATMALVGVVLLAGASIARDRLDPRYGREDVRGAAQVLASSAGPDDHIVVSAIYMVDAVAHYWAVRDRLRTLPVRPIRSRADAAAVVDAAASAPVPTWFVLSRDWEDDPDGWLGKELAARTPEVGGLGGVRIYRVGG